MLPIASVAVANQSSRIAANNRPSDQGFRALQEWGGITLFAVKDDKMASAASVDNSGIPSDWTVGSFGQVGSRAPTAQKTGQGHLSMSYATFSDFRSDLLPGHSPRSSRNAAERGRPGLIPFSASRSGQFQGGQLRQVTPGVLTPSRRGLRHTAVRRPVVEVPSARCDAGTSADMRWPASQITAEQHQKA